jgi:hypothetical protein
VVHGRNPARGSAVAGTITAEGGTARFVAADLSDPAELEDLAGHAGTVDVLVNNAGFSWFGPTAELDVATFDRLFATNVRAPYFLVPALLPNMAARGSGSIIQHRQHRRPDRPGRRRRLRRHQGHSGVNDPVLGGRSSGRRTPSWWTRPSPARRSRG